jgi:hypothetical protein
MNIETVNDFADQICDWVGCFGGCKHIEDGDGCEDKNPFCCRIGAMTWLPDRIVKAVKNDEALERENLKP